MVGAGGEDDTEVVLVDVGKRQQDHRRDHGGNEKLDD
jgi:hypothetical protein